jgi:hypothetical protein
MAGTADTGTLKSCAQCPFARVPLVVARARARVPRHRRLDGFGRAVAPPAVA